MLVSRETIADALAAFEAESTLVVDTETTGLDVWHEDRLIGVSVLCPSTQATYYLPFRHEAEGNLSDRHLAYLLSIIADRDRVIGHNLKFDILMLRKEGLPLNRPRAWGDTLILAHLVNENEPSFKLEALGKRYVDPDADRQEATLLRLLENAGYKGKNAKASMRFLPPDLVAPYAEQDTRLTWALWCRYAKAAKAQDLAAIAGELFDYASLIASMEEYGLTIDPEMTEQYREEANQRSLVVEQELAALVGQPPWLVDAKGNPKPFNAGSAVQVCRWLGVSSSKHSVLVELAQRGDSRAAKLIEYRGWSKMASSYYDVYLDKMDSQHTLHPSFLLHGTVTGRLSCTNPNLQAVARKEHEWSKVKDIFVARPGFTLVQADYSQAEMRLACHYSQEKAMTAVIESGVNMHDQTAKTLGIPRFAAKQINFSVVYGIGARTLSKSLGVSEAEAKGFLDAYHTAYPGFKRLYYQAQRIGEKNGHIRLFTGRRRRFNNRDGIAPTHKASSNLIQGGVGEMVRLAQTRLRDELAPDGIRQILQVHDSVMFEVPTEIITPSLPRIKTIMEDFPFVPRMTVDIQYGDRWGTLQDWKPS